MNPTHAQNAQNPGNYSDEISIKKEYIEHVIDQSSMSTTARLYQSEIQDQTLESSGASNQFFHIPIKELQPGMNHCIDWCSFHNKRRNYSRVPSFSAGRKSCKASLNLLYIVCIACCVNGKKSTTQGKRIPSTKNLLTLSPVDLSFSISENTSIYCLLFSEESFLNQCAKQPTTTVQASKQASLHGEACNS